MRAVPLLLFALPAALAACTQTPADTARAAAAQQAVQDDLARELAGLTPGDRSACLPGVATSAAIQTKGYGSTLIYRVGRDLKYRNDTTGGCEGIGRDDDILVTVSPGGRPCRGDIARTVDRTTRFPSGSCALGDFVEYRRR